MANRENSIKTNYIFSLLFQLLTIIVPLITTPYLSRVLQPEGIGIYSLTNTNISYFTLVGVLGLGTYGQLEVAKVKNDIGKRSQLFFEIMTTRVITHCIAGAAFMVLLALTTKYRTMYAIQGVLIVSSMLDLTWYFQGIEEFKKIAIRNIVIKLISVALIFLLVKDKNDLIMYAVILTGSNLLCNLCFYPVIGKYICKVDLKNLSLGRHVRGSLVFFLPTIASVIISSLDKTMIGIITGSESENGYYAQAYKIENLCFAVFSSLNVVMRSRMTFLFHNFKQSEMSRLLGKSLQFVGLLAFPISLGTIAITDNFVPWFFGSGYDKVKLLLPIFAFWLIFKSFSNCLLEQNIMATGRQKIFNSIIWVGAICNIILNAILISRFQSIGAAIASVVSELVIFCLAVYFSRSVTSVGSIVSVSWKYCCSAIVMGVAAYAVGSHLDARLTTTVLQIIVGACVYCICLFILRDSLTKDVYKWMRKKI